MSHGCPKCGATLESETRGRHDKWQVCEYCGFEHDVPDHALGDLFGALGQGTTRTTKHVVKHVDRDGAVSHQETTYSITSEIPVEEFTIDFDEAETVEDALAQVRRELGDEVARQIEPLLRDSAPGPVVLDVDGEPVTSLSAPLIPATPAPRATTSNVVGSRPTSPAHHDAAGLRKILVVIAVLLTLILLAILFR